MFTDRRVVLVKKCGALPAAALEMLSEYVQNPSPSTCLIFQGEKLDQRKKLFHELKAKGRTVEYKRLYENQLGPFIRDLVAEKGKRIEPAAIEMLAFLVGNNLQELAAEIEKTALYAGSREVVRIDDIRAAVSDTKVDSIFDLANAIGEKNLAKSLRNLQTIVRDGEAPLMVLSMLARHFRQLWRVKELAARGMPPQEVGKSAGINPYFVKGIMEQAKGFAIADLRKVFEMLFSADLAMKTGGGRHADLMERLVMDICVQGRK
jgi:DNA polymerase-3 subunit delta